MRRCLLLLAIVPVMCVSCYTARILTVSPDIGSRGTYSTTVTYPRTKTATTTTRVVAADKDISLYLDLQAVGAAFAQSSNVEEFEKLLNNSSYMLSNLDLNGDGYVDYLRVLETVEGNAHVFLIQACLDENIYQDVASVIAEMHAADRAYVEIVGSSYIYGPNYIIRPVYISTPLIFAHLVRAAYAPWRSPWHWGHFPPHYRHPAPILIGHYQAYVNTFMHNHKFCHEFEYMNRCHYPEYERVCREYQRNDYGIQHPERSFVVRNADIPQRVQGNVTVAPNARDIRERQAASTVSRTVATGSGRTAATAGTRGAGTTTRGSGTTATSRTGNTSGTSESATSARRASNTGQAARSGQTVRSGQTTVNSRVANSGSANTRISTTTPSGQTTTSRRGSSNAGTSASASRTSSAGSSQSAARRSAGSGSARR